MKNLYSQCTLCPRECGVDRLSGEVGFCGKTAKLSLARAALHMWEEPCISGEEGSGTVFFSGCCLRCVYCQNREIAIGDSGKGVDDSRLCEIFLELQAQGANNINLVTPTHYLPHIVEALRAAKNSGLKIPVVYNTGGYEKVESLRLLEGLVNVYLPDFKYFSVDLGKSLSFAPDYAEIAKKSIAEMVRQVGKPVFDTRGMIKKGVIVRHLVLPNQVEDSKRVLEYLYETYGNDIFISIMSQYTPLEAMNCHPYLSRKLTAEEYDEVVDFAVDLGIENGFLQEGEAAEESFIPPFDNSGV
ncbi:MAG: radical SAM protein [Clostridia bacterium]|nr:radical SAM protein [Clostridia bacterium]